MKALFPVFDETRKKPYYLQLYSYIRDLILTGEITEGEKLPSLRSLAKTTSLSITTIEQGLEQVFLLSDRKKRVYRCMYCESKA